MLIVNDKIHIPEEELTFSFARSAGPGGQNVNKVSTKAILHWHVAGSQAISAEVKKRLFGRYANKISQEGYLVLQSQRHRSQLGNIQDCREKLKEMLLAVARPPVPRRATKPSKSSIRRRLTGKKKTSEKKLRRGRKEYDGEE